MNQKQFNQFQVGYMLNPKVNINKAFNENFESNTENNLSYTTMTPIIICFRIENTHVLLTLIFYEIRNNMIFKVLISVVYCIMDNYSCVDHPCYTKTKLRVHF